MNLSAVILTKNEEKNIERCLSSLAFCDEVIIVDDYSVDKTLDKVKQLEKKYSVFIVQRKLNNDFAAQRNFGLSRASNEWVLFIDADEEVTNELAKEIEMSCKKESIDAFYIKRKDILWKKELNYGENGDAKFIRLAKKGKGEWFGKVHEEWKIKGQTITLKNSLRHYPHQTINEFIDEVNFYTTIRGQELFNNKKTVSFLSVIFYPLGKFIVNYFLKLGFLDSLQGLVFALIMSFHSFLVRAKLFQLIEDDKNS